MSATLPAKALEYLAAVDAPLDSDPPTVVAVSGADKWKRTVPGHNFDVELAIDAAGNVSLKGFNRNKGGPLEAWARIAVKDDKGDAGVQHEEIRVDIPARGDDGAVGTLEANWLFEGEGGVRVLGFKFGGTLVELEEHGDVYEGEGDEGGEGDE